MTQLLLGLAAAAMTVISVRLAALPHLARPGAGLAVLLGAFVILYVASLWLARRLSSAGRLSWMLVIVPGLLIRLPLLTAPPFLSDDIYRYLWDGRVINSGENPYRYPPIAPQLAPLRDVDWQKINHPELRTIYPPFAQAFFSTAGQVAPGVRGIRIGLVLFDLFLALLLFAGPARAPTGRWRLLLYWWHPLAIVEFAWSGHVDVLGMACLTAAFVAADSKRARGAAGGILAGALTALAALVKFIALPAAPFLVGRRWRAALLGFLVAAVLLYAPFLERGVNVTGSLAAYAERWRANDFFFGFLLRPGTPLDQELRLTEAKLFAAAAVLAIAALAVLLKPPRAAAVTAVIGASIVLSPTIHPWYAAWLLPFLAFRFSAAWFYLTLAVLLNYQPLPGYLAGRGWHELWPVKAIVYVPFAVLALRELKRYLSAPPPANGAADATARGASTDSRSRSPRPRTGPGTA